MYIPDHKPALAMAAASVYVAIAHASTPILPPQDHISLITEADQWVRLLGGIAGMLAGFASAAWYSYSFIHARRKKKKEHDDDDTGG